MIFIITCIFFTKFTKFTPPKFEIITIILKVVYMWNVFRISGKYAHIIMCTAHFSSSGQFTWCVCRNPNVSFNGKLDSSISLCFTF